MLTIKEYHFYIERHKEIKEFNTLGLYRSILENEKLTLENKIEIRDLANSYFSKTFDFLQLKDPMTYIALISLGLELTVADEKQMWRNVQANQLLILKEKDLNHRNFGTYSKHLCGYEGCPMEGLMTKKDSYFAFHNGMSFESDNKRYGAKQKSKEYKKDRKNKFDIILDALDE